MLELISKLIVIWPDLRSVAKLTNIKLVSNTVDLNVLLRRLESVIGLKVKPEIG